MTEGVPASEAGEPPLCECHGVPKLWHKRAGTKAGGHWECGERRRERWRRWSEKKRVADPEYAARRDERDRERKRKRYESLSGTEYSALLLYMRRHKALKRKAERQARRQQEA